MSPNLTSVRGIDNTKRMETSAELFGVHLKDSDVVVSVISSSYHDELQSSAVPDFYSEYCYLPLQSPLSLTQLVALLPFRWAGFPICLTCEALSIAERDHLLYHRRILQLYWSHRLPTRPAWQFLNLPVREIASLEFLEGALRAALNPPSISLD